MAIVRWEPFRDLVTAQRDLDRLFRDAFSSQLGETEPLDPFMGSPGGHLRNRGRHRPEGGATWG